MAHSASHLTFATALPESVKLVQAAALDAFAHRDASRREEEAAAANLRDTQATLAEVRRELQKLEQARAGRGKEVTNLQDACGEAAARLATLRDECSAAESEMRYATLCCEI